MIEPQHAWDIKIVLDLTFGGIGVATFIIAFLYYLKGEKEFNIKAALAGMVSLLLGLLVLITHLGKPEAAFYTMLTPNLGSVMTWGVFFNVFALLFGGLFALPGLLKLPYAANEKIMKILGTLGSIFSFLVMTYTGTLLARSSIHLWRSPATPLLFLLVALSSGVGLYALVAYILKKDVPGELVNFSMITTLLAFVTMTLYFALANISTEAFRFSVELMLTEYMWATLLLYLLGFIGPFAVYFYNKKKPSKTNLLILAVLLILQSFLARYLLVYAGAMELPW
ncbi:MAG: NrfD/PsrC family molybdoenzyme membrane anchor subunit [Thermofilum sp.]|uniref:Molybdopterin oxidoreductase, membrane subunit n=1 Tax=Thermofilum adornatum 1505 TaxID=697581 RepID=A0A3G1A500_9CREN|nr:NrfD/PsrC family molybdoenzyme membrane anchor subunit [Thermofilum adornatum]AJB41820.1 molybdopterin oxidoreductase, membrane subunit [Thermofilum adornatum 1505]